MNHIANELQTFDIELIKQNPVVAISGFLHSYAWIVTLLMLVSLASGIKRSRKSRKQQREEEDIKNMFNEDGTKNEHFTHKDYDPLPCYVSAVVFLIIRVALAVL